MWIVVFGMSVGGLRSGDSVFMDQDSMRVRFCRSEQQVGQALLVTDAGEDWAVFALDAFPLSAASGGTALRRCSVSFEPDGRTVKEIK